MIMVAVTYIDGGSTVVFTDKTSAADALGVSRKTVSAWVGAGVLNKVPHGRLYLTDAVDIIKSGRGAASNNYKASNR